MFAAAFGLVFLTPKGGIQPPIESVAHAVDAPPIPAAASPGKAPSRSPEQPAFDPGVTRNLKLAAKAPTAQRHEYLSAAVEGANRAVQLQPNSAAAQYLRGVALERSEQFGEAESAFREAARLDPGDAKSWYGLGVVLQKQNRTEDAAQALEKAVKLDPADSDARLLLAAMLAKDSPRKAREQIQILNQDSSLPAAKAQALSDLQKSISSQ